MSNAHCFWCDRSVNKSKNSLRTKDHIFSKFIRDNHNPEDKTYKVVSCYACNQERGFISCLYQIVYCNKNGWEKWTGNFAPKPGRYTRLINKLVKRIDVRKFIFKIDSKLEGQKRDLCLMEIDEVLSFPWEEIAAKEREEKVILNLNNVGIKDDGKTEASVTQNAGGIEGTC